MKCRFCGKKLYFGGASVFNPLRENGMCRPCYDIYTEFNHGEYLKGYLSDQDNYELFVEFMNAKERETFINEIIIEYKVCTEICDRIKKKVKSNKKTHNKT